MDIILNGNSFLQRWEDPSVDKIEAELESSCNKRLTPEEMFILNPDIKNDYKSDLSQYS